MPIQLPRGNTASNWTGQQTNCGPS